MPIDELSTFDEDDIRAPLEALLLVSTEPVGASTLAQALASTPGQVTQALESLRDEYESRGRGFQLREVAGGWRLYTHPAQHALVEAFVQSWDTHRLTQAALETLAVVAYTQPTTREGVRAVRGVNSDSAISSLLDKGLIREVARRGGGAIQYATTTAFLEKFGLRSIYDLPPLDEFAPDEQMKNLIRERLSGRTVQPTLDTVEEGEGE